MKITVGNSKKEFWYFISFPLLSHGSQFLGPDWEWGVSHDLRGALYCGSTERRHPNEDSWFLRHLPVLPLLRPLYIFFFNEAQEDRYKPLQHHNILKYRAGISPWCEIPIMSFTSLHLLEIATTHFPLTLTRQLPSLGNYIMTAGRQNTRWRNFA